MDGLRNLLVGIDFSPRSFAAARMAVALAEPEGASVELVHVIEMQVTDSDIALLGRSREDLESLLIDEARTALDGVASQLGYDRLQQTVLVGSPAKELARHFDERSADLLVVGDTGSRSAELSKGVGVNTYRLVERGPRKVLVVNAGHCEKIRTVAVAVSFVPVADDLMRQAHLLASTAQASLHVVHAIPDIAEQRYQLAFARSSIERALSKSRQFGEERLRDFIARYDIYDVVVKAVVLQGNPGAVLVEYLRQEDIDVVVIGTGTAIRVAGYPIGSTTHTVLNQTLSSVFVVRSLEPSS